MAEHLEIEQKFEVGADFTRPDFGGVADGVTVADPVIHHLSATYYDTTDTRLAAARITLRRRTGGTDAGWHLKLPGGGADARREVHAPLSDELPDSLAARVAEVTGGAPVVPVASIVTERTVIALTVRDQAVAEVADDLVTARRLEPEGDPRHWREVEVEVPERNPALQEAVADRLRSAGARPASRASKLARALEG
ncbi:MAG TPA: CYTH domain-containing protein [Trebonia sp.]|jgi:inorganic triphosphatase YgiF